ncbi:MAG: tRNA 4-thiouridine(8) synthase ThiI [Eubacteriales bacterium]|nr:tRNA 4-thiouridine(8) synthase ThiI [Eubacteriales bacterium]
MEKIILAKYGEIILKGLNRPLFEKRLVKNIQRALGDDVSVKTAQATVYIQCEEERTEEIAEKVSKVFGIVSVAIADVVEKDLEKIKEHAAQLMKDKTGSFKVEAKRADKRFPFKSPDICANTGGAILSTNPRLTVDVHNPDITVKVEVRDFGAYIYLNKIAGVGGMPTGSNGKATLLLSGGIDSPVAGYMIAKRGVELEAVHFYSYPYTSERAKEKVMDLAKILTSYCGTMNVHIVPFTEIQLEINDKCPEEQLTILMRRFMMTIADRIAKKNGSLALITGESVGQVASQTMESLVVTNAVCSLPVYRPVIGMDKEEIVTIARKIGTFETSILPYEDCCTVFTPKHPNTKPRLDKIKLSEEKVDFEGLVQKAIDGTETIQLKREDY